MRDALSNAEPTVSSTEDIAELMNNCRKHCA